MRRRIRLLITVVLLVSVLLVCLSQQDANLLLTAFRAAQAAVTIMLAVCFCASVLLLWFSSLPWQRLDVPRRKVMDPRIVFRASPPPLIC